VVSLVTGALFFCSANLLADKVFSKPHLSFYFALASAFIVFQSLMQLNTQAVRGLKLIKVFAMMQVFPQGFNLLFLLIVGLLWQSRDVPVYALLFGFAMTGVTGWIIMEYAFKKRMQPNDSVHPIPWSTILSISLPMLMTATMAFIIGQTGVIMLGMFRSEVEVGYYAIAVKLATLTTFILNAVNSMAGPKFSELYHSNKMDELFYVAKKSAKLIFFTTTPLLLVFLVLGKPILILVFGREFGMAYLALVFLVIGQFVNSISGSTGMFMNMTGNQNVFKNIMFIAAGLNIVTNMLLIPKYGIEGAGIASMVSFCFWNITTLVYIKKQFGKTIGYFPMFGLNRL
jgi:O-antigen/teichoic acid export membrane protein